MPFHSISIAVRHRHYTILSVLYCAIPVIYCTILYYVILYYTTLDGTMLYDSLLYFTMRDSTFILPWSASVLRSSAAKADGATFATIGCATPRGQKNTIPMNGLCVSGLSGSAV